MILFENADVSSRDATPPAEAVRGVGRSSPVVGAARLLSDGRVLLVSDQPVESGVTPQAHGSPALDGDIAAAGVEVP